MKRLVIVLALAGCASMQPPVSPEVARLQAFADSIEPGWQIKTGWANPGYLASMVGHKGSIMPGPTIYLRDEVVGTGCADVLIASLFARQQLWIPQGFGRAEVDKRVRELMADHGWTDAQINAAWRACPTSLTDLR